MGEKLPLFYKKGKSVIVPDLPFLYWDLRFKKPGGEISFSGIRQQSNDAFARKLRLLGKLQCRIEGSSGTYAHQ